MYQDRQGLSALLCLYRSVLRSRMFQVDQQTWEYVLLNEVMVGLRSSSGARRSGL